MTTRPPPRFDDQGLNLADPLDSLGIKSEYITLLQVQALRHLLGNDTGRVLDIGCGFGRTSLALQAAGWDMIGAEPSLRVLRYARTDGPQMPFVAAALPRLPFVDGSFDTVLLVNVVRPLHLRGVKDGIVDAARLVSAGGRLVVLDNIRPGHPDYVEERWLTNCFASRGMVLEARRAIRSSRWWPIYAIRYGLVPRGVLPHLAKWELSRMSKRRFPRFGYFNVVFVFRWP